MAFDFVCTDLDGKIGILVVIEEFSDVEVVQAGHFPSNRLRLVFCT